MDIRSLDVDIFFPLSHQYPSWDTIDEYSDTGYDHHRHSFGRSRMVETIDSLIYQKTSRNYEEEGVEESREHRPSLVSVGIEWWWRFSGYPYGKSWEDEIEDIHEVMTGIREEREWIHTQSIDDLEDHEEYIDTDTDEKSTRNIGDGMMMSLVRMR